MEMDRRRSERTSVYVKAELVSGDVSYEGVLENLSEEGVFMKTVPVKNAKGFVPGTLYELKIQRAQDELLSQSCEVAWFYAETTSYGLIFRIGMKIINPSEQYKTLLESL